jgi:hypothetical protein
MVLRRNAWRCSYRTKDIWRFSAEPGRQMPDDRFSYRPPKPRNPVEDLKNEYGVSDIELCDAFNAHYRTSMPGPLRPKYADAARVALMAIQEERRGVRRR